jgi:CheY-like chemotaxis protein
MLSSRSQSRDELFGARIVNLEPPHRNLDEERIALDWLKQHPMPALVLLDLMMPEVDGFEFLERIRSDEQLANLPVVVLTAKDLTEGERNFLAERTILVLSKNAQPINTLGKALSAIAGRSRSAQAEHSVH